MNGRLALVEKERQFAQEREIFPGKVEMKPSRSKRSSSPAAVPPTSSTTSLSRPRRWLFRLAAMVLGPLLLLAILEVGLRLAGIGHPMSFFLPMQINGKACLVENDRFGWRFFGPEMARAPFPFVIPKVKPPDTIRVFVFGESAALAIPSRNSASAAFWNPCWRAAIQTNTLKSSIRP